MSSSVSQSPTGEDLVYDVDYFRLAWHCRRRPFAIAAYYGCFCTLHFIFMTLSMFTHMMLWQHTLLQQMGLVAVAFGLAGMYELLFVAFSISEIYDLWYVLPAVSVCCL
jgi:hypothetical protein